MSNLSKNLLNLLNDSVAWQWHFVSRNHSRNVIKHFFFQIVKKIPPLLNTYVNKQKFIMLVRIIDRLLILLSQP